MIRVELSQLLKEKLKSLFSQKGIEEIPSFSIDLPPLEVRADFATNLPLVSAKVLKKAPRQIAQDMADRINGEKTGLCIAEPSGAGFLNFFLENRYLIHGLSESSSGKFRFNTGEPKKKILLEYISANPTGPLHIGHGRGAALGDSLARIFRVLGDDVTTEYYVNDVGNQIENLGVSLALACEGLHPGYLDDQEKTWCSTKSKEDLYKGDYIRDVAREVIQQNANREGSSKGKVFFCSQAVQRILKGIRGDLEAFGVGINSWLSEESLYRSGLVEKALQTLVKRKLAFEKEGAVWFASSKFGDNKDRVLKRRDERPTYFASDIAYHHQKYERGFDRLIDIWGADHHGYVSRVKGAVEALGHDSKKLEILLYQLVSLVRAGKPVAMSTRAGEFVTLQEVLDEVGKDAVRFFMGLRGPGSHFEFDLDLAKKSNENPVYYVQYVHARCSSIFREAVSRGYIKNPDEISHLKWDKPLEPEIRALAVAVRSLPDVVWLCARDLSPHHLTGYLLDLSRRFHRFYEKQRVLGEDRETSRFRLGVVQAVKQTVAKGLDLLGVSAPDKM